MHKVLPFIFGTLLLCSCSEPDGENLDVTKDRSAIVEIQVTLNDGRVLECIQYQDGMAQRKIGSLDCNWDHPLNEEQ